MDNKTEYKVIAFQKSQTKNGKDMWRLTLETCEDKKPLTGVIWSEDIPRFDGTKFKVGNIITFLGQDYNSNYNSVVIKNVEVKTEALSGMPEELTKQYLTILKQYLATLQNNYVNPDTSKELPYASLAAALDKEISTRKFGLCPAAEKMHHNYLGGLLKHTYEVFSICKILCKMFPVKDMDGLLLAAIAHDVGKQYEYKVDLKLGTAMIDQEWMQREVSHTLFGFTLAHDFGAFNVARMIGAHHGKIEWGAMFEPETPEEKVLHFADMLSATIGIISIDRLTEVIKAMQQKQQEKEQSKKEENSNESTTDSEIL